MADGWPVVSIGDACDILRDRVDPARLPPDQMLTHFSIPALDTSGGPIVERAGGLGSHKFRVAKPSVLVSLLNPRIPRSVLTEGGPSVICSTEMAVLQVKSSDAMSIEFLGLVVTTDAFRRDLRRLVAGTTGSRQRVDPAELLSARIPLPPPAAQRRIVDLIKSVDAVGDAAGRESGDTRRALAAFLGDVVVRVEGRARPVAAALALSIGGNWGMDLGSGELDLPVYRQTEFSEDGALLRPAGATRSFSKHKVERRVLRPDDILLQKSAGTPSLPGRVVRVPGDIDRSVPSNFLQLLRPDHKVAKPAFLFWHLWWTHRVGGALEYQAGTNIRNLDVPRYLGREMVFPPLVVQRRIAAAADHLNQVVLMARTTSERTRQLRASLLRDLLEGSHEIPASYDRFLEGAA